MEMMDTTELIRWCSLVIVFLVVIFCDLKTWYLTEIGILALFTAGHVLMPRMMLNQATHKEVKFNRLHLHLESLYGCHLFMSAVIRLLCRKSTDSKIHSRFVALRALEIVVILLVQALAWKQDQTYSKPKWNNQFLYYGLLGRGLWLVVCLIHLLRHQDQPEEARESYKLNNHLFVDALWCVPVGLFLFGYPDTFLQLAVVPKHRMALDRLHLLQTRQCGALFMSAGLLSLQGMNFTYIGDKRKLLIGRLLTLLLLYVSYGIYTYLHKIYIWRDLVAGLALGSFIPLTNAIIGVLRGSLPQKMDKTETDRLHQKEKDL